MVTSLLLLLTSFAATKPNVVHVVVDDLGYNDLGYKNKVVESPVLDNWAKNGVQLTDYYVFVVCAPTRASILTGRYPWRIGYYYVGGDNMGVNTSFSMLPKVLKEEADYQTVAIGKWHCGAMEKAYTPTYRGFDSYFGYYAAATKNYWYHGGSMGGCDAPAVDFTDNKGTTIQGAKGQNGTYSTRSFTEYAVSHINNHDTDKPLYMYLAHQATHDTAGGGIQAPLDTVNRYPYIVNDTYKVMSAAITELDWGLGNVTEALRQKGMWNNTIMIVTTDNGGPLTHSYNYPLRGGKHTYWEGGVRGEAFVYSELLPEAVRGTKYSGMIHTSDWYPTIIEGIAGLKMPSDTGPKSVDGFNMWPSITTGAASPRSEVIVEVSNSYYSKMPQVIRSSDYKLIVGDPGDSRILPFPANSETPIQFGLTGGVIENGTDHCTGPNLPGTGPKIACDPYCLFDVANDPTESNDLSGNDKYRQIIADMQQRLQQAASDAMPFSVIYSNSSDFSDAKKAICDIIEKTGFIEPADSE